jgi:putative DNA primase/helicase
VMLDNAADRARCFPDLWPTPEAAKQDRWRTVTICYYRNIYNSEMLPSSVTVTYQPAGAGQKPRRAMFDLEVIQDPRAWLEQRLGQIIRWEME